MGGLGGSRGIYIYTCMYGSYRGGEAGSRLGAQGACRERVPCNGVSPLSA